MPNPFESRREAISGAAPLEIERAVDLIDYVTHAPDYAEAQAKRWEHEANAIIEKINITPEFAESLKDFAAAQHQQVTRVREYGETFRRGHADRLAKLDRADPREAKWDISVNQG
jgi:membrane protein required for beta-lactamase induction